jgi:hypothetical protein
VSKFAEKIRKVTRVQSQPLGFGAVRTAAEPSMVLAGRAADAASAAELARRGADVVIIGTAQSPAAAAAVKDVAGGAIAGAFVPGTAANEAKTYREAGFDFVVFDPDSAAAIALLEQEIGYVMVLPPDLTDSEARALETFHLDAIDIGVMDGPLTVRKQIDLRRLHAMVRKPLMATVAGDIPMIELQALRDTNVVVAVADSADAVGQLRKTIDALPVRSHRKDGEDRPTPLVPRTTAAEEEDEHDHDHDE